MTVEANNYRLRRRNEGENLVSSETSAPGSIEGIDFHNPTRVLIACEADNSQGTIFVIDPRNIKARLYEFEKDSEGKRILLNKKGETRIVISGDQILELFNARQKKLTEIFHISDDDAQEDEAPQVGDLVNIK